MRGTRCRCIVAGVVLAQGCAPEGSGTVAGDGETGRLVADTGADTADSGLPAGDAFPFGFGERADVRVLPCGSVLRESVLAPGPDLDGDGLGELAVGLPGADGDVTDAGAVLLLSGASIAAGVHTEADAHAVVTLVDASGARMARAAFGSDLRWVGDRDGDGLDDLWTGAAVVSGARLRAGGATPVTHVLDGDAVAFARWDDLDGDGRDDWVFGFPERGIGGASGHRGALGPVLDVDFDGAATPDLTRETVGLDAAAAAGQAVAVLGQDLDHDGVRELVSTLGNDVVVLNSRAVRTWATYVDEAVRGRVVGAWGGSAGARETLLVLGDVDRAGVDDLATLLPDGLVCTARGEDVVAGAATPRCDTLSFLSALAQGDDLDGDGVRELWGVRTRPGAGLPELVGIDPVDLLRGVGTERVAVLLPGEISAAPWLVLDGSDGYPYWSPAPLGDAAPWLPRDLVVDQVAGPRHGGQSFQTCMLSPDALAAGGTFVAAGMEAVCGAPAHLGTIAAWSGNARGGDGVRDIVAVVYDGTSADTVLRVWDGVTGVPEDLGTIVARTSGWEALAAGPVPDLAGAGAPGAWVLTRDGTIARGGVVGRPMLAVSLARPR